MKRFVIMGVSGTGKSLIGSELAKAMGATYVDGDDLHPPENVDKMAAGIPLDDDDRGPWLDRVSTTLNQATGDTIIGCSALKRRYRDRIRAGAGGPVKFLYLDGPRELIASRMGMRTGHYMPASLLDSQFDALERPAPDEDALTVPIAPPPEAIVAFVLERLGLRP